MSISKRLLYVLPVLILLAVPAITHAQFFSGIASNALAMVMFGVSFVIASIFGLLITVETWIFQIVLALNTQVVNSDPVKFGFPVALGFTNLLFVVAILVIALATIIRWDSYAVKQTLWKLVLIALLVNFGLVIANAILSFSDSLTLYFVQSVDPGGAALNSDDGFASFMRFGGALAGAFSPQRLWLTDPNLAASMDVKANQADWKTKMAAGGSTIGGILQPIFGVFFTLIGSMMIAVTLAGLIIMFLYRYVTLAYLMIILPLAWAAFIFPKTEKHWHAWWDSFWKQLLFGPVAIFMLWLGIQVSYVMFTNSSGFGSYAVFTSTSSNPVWDSISNLVGTAMGSIIQGFLNMILMISIIGGGLGMAKKMGGAGADVAHNMVMKPVEGLQVSMKNRAKNRARAIGREAVTPTLDRFQAKGGLRGRLAGAFKGVIGTPLAQWNKDIKAHKSQIDETRSVNEVLEEINKPNYRFRNDQEMFAILDYLKGEKALSRVQFAQRFNTQEMKNKFEQYKRGHVLFDLNKETGSAVSGALLGGKIQQVATSADGLKSMAGLFGKIETARGDLKFGLNRDTIASHIMDEQQLSAYAAIKPDDEAEKVRAVEAALANWDSPANGYASQLMAESVKNLTPEQARDFVKELSSNAKVLNAWSDKAGKYNLESVLANNPHLAEFVETNVHAKTTGYKEIFTGRRPVGASAGPVGSSAGGPGRTPPPSGGVGAPPPVI